MKYIPIIDPHVDVADMYKWFGFELDDFFAPTSPLLTRMSEAEVEQVMYGNWRRVLVEGLG